MKVKIGITCSILALFFVGLVSFNCGETPTSTASKTQKIMATTQHHHPNHPNNPYYSHTDTNSLRNVPLSEWKKILPANIYHIAFEKGTDPKFQGYWDYKGKGVYYCAVCGNKLFYSTAKFASTCGWPSFFEPVKGAVIYKPDHSFGMNRTEVMCARCGAHLGHVFNDGPPPTGKRYCMDSSVLDFMPLDSLNKMK